MPLYSVAKPFVWHRNESTGSVLEEWSGDEVQGEMKGDQVNVEVFARMPFPLSAVLRPSVRLYLLYSFVYHFSL